ARSSLLCVSNVQLCDLVLVSTLFVLYVSPPCVFCFFFTDTATTEIYTLSLHDALPISTLATSSTSPPSSAVSCGTTSTAPSERLDRKSTRLNSSHVKISYAVFCLKKKKKKKKNQLHRHQIHNNKKCRNDPT